jgi:hypothetical protein
MEQITLDRLAGVSPAWQAILTQVDTVSAELGVAGAAWRNPHVNRSGVYTAPPFSSYSRYDDLDRFRILWSRAAAWEQVIAKNGWAQVATPAQRAAMDWAAQPGARPVSVTVLRPARHGAAPLTLARTGAEEGLTPGIIVGMGNRITPISVLPECGCNACDEGSEAVLAQLDSAIMTVLDGSCEAVVTRDSTKIRTPFGTRSTQCAPDECNNCPLLMRPAAWFADWAPMPMTAVHGLAA